MIVAVTGHRPDKLGGWYQPNPVYNFVVQGLHAAFTELKPSYVITGMALGVDQWAAEVCLNMGIPYVAAIPFEGQDSIWPPHARAKYAYLMKSANAAYVISPGPFEPKKMQLRNEWMVRECQTLVAVWDGSNGGTSNCVGFAQSIGRPIHFVPLNHEIRQLAEQLRPKKKEVKVLTSADVEEAFSKTPVSTFINTIKEKAEAQVQVQLKAAKEAEELKKQKKLSEFQAMLKKEAELDKQVEQLLKSSTKQEKKPGEDVLKYNRVMDLDE